MVDRRVQDRIPARHLCMLRLRRHRRQVVLVLDREFSRARPRLNATAAAVEADVPASVPLVPPPKAVRRTRAFSSLKQSFNTPWQLRAQILNKYLW